MFIFEPVFPIVCFSMILIETLYGLSPV